MKIVGFNPFSTGAASCEAGSWKAGISSPRQSRFFQIHLISRIHVQNIIKQTHSKQASAGICWDVAGGLLEGFWESPKPMRPCSQPPSLHVWASGLPFLKTGARLVDELQQLFHHHTLGHWGACVERPVERARTIRGIEHGERERIAGSPFIAGGLSERSEQIDQSKRQVASVAN